MDVWYRAHRLCCEAKTFHWHCQVVWAGYGAIDRLSRGVSQHQLPQAAVAGCQLPQSVLQCCILQRGLAEDAQLQDLHM